MYTDKVINRVLCSICIATYKRPQLLNMLLESLFKQDLPPDVDLEIIVVDNDSDQTARSIVSQFESQEFPVIYLHEPRKNISHARNAAIKAATGDYLLFIDDDETASPTWVRYLLEAISEYDADVVLGRVISKFHNDAPEWIKDVYLFNRPVLPTGTQPRFYGIGNALIKSSLIGDMEFDPRYGVTGGEDSYFLITLKKLNKDAHYVYSKEAVVEEYIPPDRTKLLWITKRAARTGNLYTYRQISMANNKSIARLKQFVRVIILLIVCFLLMIISFPFTKHRVHWYLKTAANFGKFTAIFNRRIAGY